MARIVYTSGPAGGRSVPEERSAGEPRVSSPAERQRVRVRVERAGRRGKTVTVAGPFSLTRADAADLLAELKRACGGGGSLKPIPGRAGFDLELQGDHAARLPDLLRERGYRQAR